MDIKQLHEANQAAHAEVKNLVERQSQEIKTLGETTDSTATQLKAAEQRLEQIEKDFSGRLEEVEKRAGRPEGAAEQAYKSAGALFVESAELKTALERGMRETGRVEVKSITSAGDSVGEVSVSQRVPGIKRDPADRMNFVRDLLNVSQTSSGSIEYYVDHSGFENNSSVQGSELSTKGESDLKLEARTMPVSTIAHFVVASRQVLDDVPMLRSYIDGRLRYGLSLREDEQILYGDGSNSNLTGIMNADIQDHGDRPSGQDRISHIRRAMVKARMAEYPVDGIVMHPEDWAEIELLKSDDGHYIWAWYMAANGQARVWRVPVVETTAMEAGDFVLGSWEMAATLWDRQQAGIRLSESHANLFTQNGVAILGEERLALTVERPKAFVKGSFTEEASN